MMNRMIVVLAVVLTALFVSGGCNEKPTALAVSALPTIEVKIGATTLTLEVADEPAEQEKGLMFRESMPTSHGMLFSWPRSEMRAFFMKNTLIPLDIVFLDDAGVVTEVKSMAAMDLRATRSTRPARYAIELNAGQAAALGIRPGMTIPIPPGQ
jgi:uncharacterized protein